MEESYTVPVRLYAAIVGLLNTLPAHQSRLILNEMEADCQRQEREKEQMKMEAIRRQILSEVQPGDGAH